MYFKLAPGVRMRVNKHGVRTSLGPRAARVHVGGGYRAGVSTGAGPVTLYHGIGGAKRRKARSSGGSSSRSGVGRATVVADRRQVAAEAKSAEAIEIVAALQTLTDLHRHAVEPVVPPVAPEPPAVDESGIRQRHLSDATKGTRFWKRAERRTAAQQAGAAADVEVAAARADLEEQRRHLQAQLDERWRELLANEPDVVLATLTEAFEDNEAHAAAVAVDGDEVSVVVFVPGTDIVPDRLPSQTPAGNLSLKKMTQSQSAGFYTTAVCGHVLATVREALTVAPGLASVRVASIRLGPPDVYGHSHPECLTAATFARVRLQGVEWSEVESPAVFDQCATHVTMSMSGRVKQLEPVDLAGEPELAALVAAIDVEH
jgi:hypothetical protein